MVNANKVQIFDNYNSRCSCRAFSNRSIPPEILAELLSAALRSASGGNLQPFSILTIKNNDSKQLLADCCSQAFIANAPICFLFLLDWYKLSLFARSARAPFVANLSFDYNLTAYADIMCAMQRIESLAHSYGLGCCYVGNIMGSCEHIKEHFNLPKLTYPIMLMPLGYPAQNTPLRQKLPLQSMVFDEIYPTENMESILAGYHELYKNEKGFSLPASPESKLQILSEIRKALLTTYSPEEAEDILIGIQSSGYVSNIMWRFSLKYKAHTMADDAAAIKADFEAQGIYW